jgi:hypothetical protein
VSFFGRLFGGKQRRQARAAAEARARSLLEAGNAAAAWRELADALARDPDEMHELLRAASLVLRGGGERDTAELCDRAADAPHDPQRWVELGSRLLSSDEAEVAAAALERALAFVPFDAVVRSELAIAQARSGRPRESAETLALHPCLGDDPGALFQFAWASLLAGDLEAAHSALAELRSAPGLRSAGGLREKLGAALERADLGMRASPPDARDYYFLEHAGIVVDNAGPLGGRYDALEIDRARAGRIVAHAGALARELAPDRAHRVICVDDRHERLARSFAGACGGKVVTPKKNGRFPSGVVPLLSADRADALDKRDRDAEGTLLFAMTMRFDRCVSRAPDIVGAFARTPAISDDALGTDGAAPPIDEALRAFTDERRELLFPRARYPYAPDEPLPRR